MKINEMHVLFRQLGQQMGMQTVRNIRPEEIDVCLNTAIDNTIKRIIAENLTLASNDIFVRTNAKVGQINAIRTLYSQIKIEDIKLADIYNYYTFNIDCSNVMYITGIEVRYDTNHKHERCFINGRFYECRICDLDTINYVLNDYCSRPTYDYPVCAFESNEKDVQVKLYTSAIGKGKQPVEGNVTIIRNPAIVDYEKNIDCDLPEFIHTDIVQLAVDIFNKSVAITTN